MPEGRTRGGVWCPKASVEPSRNDCVNGLRLHESRSGAFYAQFEWYRGQVFVRLKDSRKGSLRRFLFPKREEYAVFVFPHTKDRLSEGAGTEGDWGSQRQAKPYIDPSVPDSFHHCVVPHPVTPRCQERGLGDVHLLFHHKKGSHISVRSFSLIQLCSNMSLRKLSASWR